MHSLKFSKMHGLGNDFMVINGIDQGFDLQACDIVWLANRHTGVGFDQLLLIEAASSPEWDFNYRIFNADGSEVEHCGNGARCFAKYVYEQGLTDKTQLNVKIKTGVLRIDILSPANGANAETQYRVAMGEPILQPEKVPFIANLQTPAGSDAQSGYLFTLPDTRIPDMPLAPASLAGFVLSMGNPHVVFVVEDLPNYPVSEIGVWIQSQACFPQSVNVGFAEIHSPAQIGLRVFERGAGETQACGTGACAAVYALHQAQLLGPAVSVKLLGGVLKIDIADNKVTMTGPATQVFEGQIDKLNLI